MIQLRKDYILNRWSYIASDRAKRPQQFKKDKAKNNKESVCYFCPGSENLTPLEIGRVSKKNKKDEWQVRWFLNKFPAVDESLKKEIKTTDKYYTNGEAFGFHEIIVETPDHEKQLADLGVKEIEEVLKVYALRMEELSAKEGIKYVQIFKNSGAKAGTSLVHSHSQIIATNAIPSLIQEKTDAVKKYKSCPYCEIIKSEEKSERFICDNNDFICFAPYAPRFNYEALIFPKKHYKNITELKEAEFKNLAEIFKTILPKLEGAGISYNFYLHYSPIGGDLHFHFVIAPRVNTWAGFELATNSFIIKISPEDAAEFYKEN
ncbi:MAG: galactose-1-phosphate uridylyltransferase [Candidatus Pacebacteria bacterium]|nr:galactose-1-phosphate uridylyltransferase [Candidatus Paceibacterota bacterium]